MTNGNLCLESGKRRKPYGARERSLAAARDLLSSSRNCTEEAGRDGTTEGHGPPEALGLRDKEMETLRSLNSQFTPSSSEQASMALLSNLNSPPFVKWRAQIITPNPPLKSTWPLMGPSRASDNCGRREQLSLPFSSSRARALYALCRMTMD